MIVHGNSSGFISLSQKQYLIPQNCSNIHVGLIQLCISKLPSQVQKLNLTPKRANFSKAILVSTRIRTTTSSRIRCASYSARSYHELKTNDGSDSFWLSLTKEAIGGFRSLGVFLVVQPSQLRYIEWPSFRSTMEADPVTFRDLGLDRPGSSCHIPGCDAHKRVSIVIITPIGSLELKTASLTLVLVALLIVALSSIDSVLCYLLAVVLRRAA
ncbi:hypothetical protein GIB67_020834 [Kingdonia uniflora]|uniref:Uncharacterized protein n=1 Tax=Kingdonia uniflora TaxID=39325 RepID=A0A7J7M785_9MAGN|nr:hypothetical protein GIB67_020834 [Kingdonia uniflora]